MNVVYFSIMWNYEKISAQPRRPLQNRSSKWDALLLIVPLPRWPRRRHFWRASHVDNSGLATYSWVCYHDMNYLLCISPLNCCYNHVHCTSGENPYHSYQYSSQFQKKICNKKNVSIIISVPYLEYQLYLIHIWFCVDWMEAGMSLPQNLPMRGDSFELPSLISR